MNILLYLFLLSQPQIHPGFPIKVVSYNMFTFLGGVKAFDIDGDGSKEIFVSLGSGDYMSFLYGFRADGSEVPGFPVPLNITPAFAFKGVAIGNILAGEPPAIVFGSHNPFNYNIPPGEIYAYTFSGNLVWDNPYTLPDSSGLLYPVTLYDLDGNGSAEILIHSNTLILDGYGNVWGNWGPGQYSSERLLACDINNDGVTEIIGIYRISQNHYQLVAWDIDGNLLPGWPVPLPSPGYQETPALADIDQDGYMEIIVPGASPTGPSDTAYLSILRYDGSYFPGFPLVIPEEDFHAPPAIADIDQDGELEVIVDGIYETLVINIDGSYTTIPNDGLLYGGEPAVADVDGDGNLEVITGRHYIVRDTGAWHAYRLDGSEPEGWPLYVEGWTFGTPLIDDIDGDGLLEMAVYSKSAAEYYSDTGWLYLFDLPAPFDSARVPWGQYAHDLWNSGIYGFNPPVSVAEKPSLQIHSFYQVVYRNGIPELIFTLNHPQTLQLNLYDITGRMLWRNVSRYPSGTHRLRLPGNIPSGVHILKLRGNQKQALKVIKLR